MARERRPRRVGRAGISAALGLDEHPRRGIAVAMGGLMAVVAMAMLAVWAVHPGNGRCSGIILQQQRNTCLYYLAENTGNALYCNEISVSGTAGRCIDAVALAASDPSTCLLLKASPSDSAACIENVSYTTGRQRYCDLIGGSGRTVCDYGFAKLMNFSEPSYCYAMNGTAQGGDCISHYYFNKGMSTGNYSDCGMLSNVTNSSIVGELVSENESYVAEIPQGNYSGISPRYLCYYLLASKGIRSGECGSISNLTVRARCESAFAEQANASAVAGAGNVTGICSGISGTARGLGPLCYFTLYTEEAISARNTSYCGLLNGSYAYSCITHVASYYNQSSYCGEIENATAADACRYQAGIHGN